MTDLGYFVTAGIVLVITAWPVVLEFMFENEERVKKAYIHGRIGRNG